MTEETRKLRYHTANNTSNMGAAITSVNTDIDDSPEQERATINIINNVKEITQRMLGYAIKNPAIIVEEKLLEKIVPVLRKDSNKFEDSDEVILWSSYNDLTQLIKPATNYSLMIANQLNEELGSSVPKKLVNSLKFYQKPQTPLSGAVKKCHKELRTIFFYLIATVFFYVLIQGYSGLLSNSLDEVNKYIDKWHTNQELMMSDKLSPKELETATQHGIFLGNALSASTQFLVDLTQPLFLFNPDNTNVKEHCKNVMDYNKSDEDKKRIGACISFQKQYANSTLLILSQYILPLILGTLGATAFIVRNTLDKLQTDSYLPSANGKLSMRLCLGGLLGVLSGVFMSTSTVESLAGFNINLVMVSLIMGYSVEVAFSLFDSVVSRMRAWTESLKKA
jgi:hypothetical protein